MALAQVVSLTVWRSGLYFQKFERVFHTLTGRLLYKCHVTVFNKSGFGVFAISKSGIDISIPEIFDAFNYIYFAFFVISAKLTLLLSCEC